MLQRLRALEDLDWTYVAPPRTIEPGERTGDYRVLEGQLVGDPDGESRISMEDFAVALADETEAADWPQAHLGVGY